MSNREEILIAEIREINRKVERIGKKDVKRMKDIKELHRLFSVLEKKLNELEAIRLQLPLF
jgi:hypothetical protein